jgi:hypothetical protein
MSSSSDLRAVVLANQSLGRFRHGNGQGVGFAPRGGGAREQFTHLRHLFFHLAEEGPATVVSGPRSRTAQMQNGSGIRCQFLNG